MKGLATTLVTVCLLAGVAIWYLRQNQPPMPPPVAVPPPAPVKLPPPAPPAVPKMVDVPPSAPTPRMEPGPIKAPPPPPVTLPPGYLESIRSSPEMQEMEEVALQLRNFGQRFGGNPTGSNAEIATALNGGNEKRAIYLPQNAQLNGNGELLDPWGTPYFFHSNSATETEVRSAGPDKILHTRDDLTTK